MCAPSAFNPTYMNALLGGALGSYRAPQHLRIPIFISHSWAYPGHYDTIAGWLFGNKWEAHGTPVIFTDASVPKSDPIHDAPNESALRNAIYQRIAASSVVLIPTGMYTSHSRWIQKEIDGAKLLGKPILAVNPWGQERKCSVVVEACHLHVGWNKDSVARGVWRLSGHG